MKFLGFALLLSVSVLMLSCESAPPNSEVAEVRTGTWIDVRGASEFSAGHLDGAVNIPHDQIGDKVAAVVPDKNAEIHLYCRSGRRSDIALKTLEDMGYTNVVNEGGYTKLVGQ